MLQEFLPDRREEILRLCKSKISAVHPGVSDPELDQFLAGVFDELVDSLRLDAAPISQSRLAVSHGQRRYLNGSTLADLIHDYGALCQSVAEVADRERQSITAHELQGFNRLLDIGIAEAATQYARLQQDGQEENLNQKLTEHLGFVVHELRNALTAAMLSFEAIRTGHAPLKGHTAGVLERSLQRLKALVDQVLDQVRTRAGLRLRLEPIFLSQLLEEVRASTTVGVADKTVELSVEPSIRCVVDRRAMASAASNLVQNALKYSRPGARIQVRGQIQDSNVMIEVEDECGGLPDGKVEALFSPFVQGGADRSGLGLGLAIARQAVEAHRGKIHVRNLPGKGCVFVITFPGLILSQSSSVAAGERLG